ELPEQPIGDAIATGAVERAKAAQQYADVDFGVGIEAGLLQLPGSERWMSVQVCAIVDRTGRCSMGMGPGYELPKPILDAVLAGEPLREAFERTLDLEDPERRGAVFYLSDARIDRMELTVQAVRMALTSYQSMDPL
ncbi:inosine/xanthosine triphosphatase, partial [Candidatus Bipolaricaulota bacterium]